MLKMEKNSITLFFQLDLGQISKSYIEQQSLERLDISVIALKS